MSISKKKLLDLAEKEGTPLYVYELASVRKAYKSLERAFKSYKKTRIHYAMKANAHKSILKELKKLGAGLECVSIDEVKFGLSVGFKPSEILFTSTSLPEKDMSFLISKKIMVNLDSLSQIERYGELKPGGKVSVRVNGDIGAGHHEHVVTGGVNSKFGIHYSEIEKVKEVAGKYGLEIVGLHQHIGHRLRWHALGPPSRGHAACA